MEHQLVSFKLGNEEYAVDILSVQEINRMVDITKMPKAPDYVEGVINLRGKVIPVVSLRKKFGFPDKENDANSRIVVADVNGNVAGMIVDSVSEVFRIAEDTIEPAPPIASGVNTEYIKGVGKLNDRLIILLDIGKIMPRETAMAA